MSLTAPTYFEYLKAYLNKGYVTCDCVDGNAVLTEKYYQAEDNKQRLRKITLRLPGPGLVFKLDQDEIEEIVQPFSKGKKQHKAKPPLFHFLDDEAKPWSKRCDFVVFYVNGNKFCADCIEFKSKSLAHDKIVPQLKAGECWVWCMKRTIERYTHYKKPIQIRKFVFAENENPDAFLDRNRQLTADPSIRYYHFKEVDGQPLAELKNTSTEEI